MTSPIPAVATPAKAPTLAPVQNDHLFVDLHADTPMHGLTLDDDANDANLLMKIWMGLTRIGNPHFCRQITDEALQRRVGGAQVFSVTTEGFPPFWRWSHQFYTQAVAGRPKHANDTRFNAIIDQLAWIHRESKRTDSSLSLFGGGNDGLATMNESSVGIYIGIEGASPLLVRPGDEQALRAFLQEPDNGIPEDMILPNTSDMATMAGRADFLARSGVLYVGLNHINSSEFAGSDFVLAARRGKGLTPEGRELVGILNGAGILVDAAHASKQTQKDLVGLCTLPLIVSHGILPRHEGDKIGWRDTAPELLDEIKRTGGLFGVMFATNYLDKDAVAHIVDQIDFIKNRIGIDYAAFGSDADGFVGMAIDTMDVTPILEEMRARGYTEEDIAKVRVGNFERMLAVRAERMQETRPRQKE